MAVAFVFPGQGSQDVGMGRDLAAEFSAAREVFAEVDEALGQKLSTLMFEGPKETLTLTENAQPALMAVSMAALRVLEKEKGLKLALTAAGAFDIATAAKLLRLRGEAMQKATPPGTGAMAALLGAEIELAQEICAAAAPNPETGKAEVVEAANDNGGGQVVISGAKAAVERAIEIAKEKGVKRAMLLPVSAPFHCALMAPAADAMAEALGKASMKAPVVPVVANVTAAKASYPAEIRDLLVKQVTGTVRWRECVAAMAAMGGAGKVLSGLMKRNAPEATALSIGNPAELEAFLKSL